MEGRNLSDTWARPVTRVLLSAAAVALVTGAVFLLRPVAPALSLGVLYVVAVVVVAVLYGLANSPTTTATAM